MLITEELFLLLTTDRGKVEGSSQRGYGLAGAVVTDLVLAGRAELSEDRDPRVQVRSREPLGDSILDPALARLAEKNGRKLSTLVADGKLNPEGNVVRRLADQGVIQVQGKKLLGLAPARYPVVDDRPERATRERLRTVLADGTATPHDATLLSILQGLGVAAQVLKAESGNLGKKELKARIAQISRDCEAGPAIKKSLDALNAALIAAVVIPTIAATATS